MLFKIFRTFIVVFAIASATFFVYELWLIHEMIPIENNYEAINNNVKLDPSVKIDKVIVYKGKRSMLLLRGGEVLKTYRVSLGKNPVGPKEKEGDKKTPEGKYILDWKNPNSKYHLSIHISYPNDDDKRNAEQKGVSPGGEIMIHGCPNGFGWNWKYYKEIDWTDGCIAVSNEEIEEIWNTVENGTEIEINP
jgi:murein L,D-transpeptidase YafK